MVCLLERLCCHFLISCFLIPTLVPLKSPWLCICVRVCVLVTQLCPTLWDSMDCSSPDSSVNKILQERILEWVASLFSRGSSQPRNGTKVSHIASRFFIIWATRKAPPWVYWNFFSVTLHWQIQWLILSILPILSPYIICHCYVLLTSCSTLFIWSLSHSTLLFFHCFTDPSLS